MYYILPFPTFSAILWVNMICWCRFTLRMKNWSVIFSQSNGLLFHGKSATAVEFRNYTLEVIRTFFPYQHKSRSQWHYFYLTSLPCFSVLKSNRYAWPFVIVIFLWCCIDLHLLTIFYNFCLHGTVVLLLKFSLTNALPVFDEASFVIIKSDFQF